MVGTADPETLVSRHYCRFVNFTGKHVTSGLLCAAVEGQSKLNHCACKSVAFWRFGSDLETGRHAL